MASIRILYMSVTKLKQPLQVRFKSASLKGKRSKYDRFLGDLDKNAAIDEENEEDFDLNVKNMDVLNDAARKAEAKNKTKKFKTIQRKYFKQPQEMNLLTWDAKEQIRYLHREFPAEWTVEKLTESFPVNIDGVKMLLSSSYTPTLKEVIKHDKRVQKHWLLLKDGNKKGPVDLRYERLSKDHKLEKLAFAAGNKALPHTTLKMIPEKTTECVNIDTSGPFASIVKGYAERSKQLIEPNGDRENQKESSEALLLLKKHETENLKLLEEATGVPFHQLSVGKNNEGSISRKTSLAHMFKHKDKYVVEEEQVDSILDKFSKSFTSDRNKAEVNDVMESGKKQKERRTNFGNHNLMNRSMLDIPDDSSMEIKNSTITDDFDLLSLENINSEESGNKSRPLARRRGTWKSRKDNNIKNGTELEPDTIKDDYIRDQNSNSHLYKQKELLKEIKYDYPVRSGEKWTRKEAYVYDQQKGYQHPFGKFDPSYTDIDVSKKMESSTEYLNEQEMYRKGKNYYDEDGEFLFKIP